MGGAVSTVHLIVLRLHLLLQLLRMIRTTLLVVVVVAVGASKSFFYTNLHTILHN